MSKNRRGITVGMRASVAAWSVGAAWLVGCASNQNAAQVSPVFQGEAPPAIGEITPALCFPPVLRAGTMLVLEGEREGKALAWTLTPSSAERSEWTITIREEQSGAPVTEESYTTTAEGHAALVRSVSHDDRVISVFEPPMVVMPAHLKPGEAFKQTLTLTVHPMSDPKSVQDEGPATQEIAYEADEQVLVSGAGVRDKYTPAVRVRATFTASLRAAKVRTTTESWFEAGAKPSPEPAPTGSAQGDGGGAWGLIAQRQQEVATFLGLPVRDKRGLFRLVELEGAR